MKKFTFISNLGKLAIGGMLLALYSYMFAGMLITVIEKYN